MDISQQKNNFFFFFLHQQQHRVLLRLSLFKQDKHSQFLVLSVRLFARLENSMRTAGVCRPPGLQGWPTSSSTHHYCSRNPVSQRAEQRRRSYLETRGGSKRIQAGRKCESDSALLTHLHFKNDKARVFLELAAVNYCYRRQTLYIIKWSLPSRGFTVEEVLND